MGHKRNSPAAAIEPIHHRLDCFTLQLHKLFTLFTTCRHTGNLPVTTATALLPFLAQVCSAAESVSIPPSGVIQEIEVLTKL